MTYTVEQFEADLAEPYAWPGGYPRYFVAHDGEALSYAAATENKAQIVDDIRECENSGWRVIGCEINWEDTELYCAHTNKRIPSAYGDD
jgi:hypothetical protein